MEQSSGPTSLRDAPPTLPWTLTGAQSTDAPAEGPEFAVAIDPGQTTGVVVCTWRDSKSFQVVLSEEAIWKERIDVLDRILRNTLVARVVLVEDFRLYKAFSKTMVNNRFEAVQVIGNVQAILWGLSGLMTAPIIMLPAHVKQGVQILPEHAKWFSGRGEHARDAYKLFRYWWLMRYAAEHA